MIWSYWGNFIQFSLTNTTATSKHFYISKMSASITDVPAATPSLFNTSAPRFATFPGFLVESQENTVLEQKSLQEHGEADETPTLNTVCVNERIVPFAEPETPMLGAVQTPGFLENDDDATPTLSGPNTVVNTNFQRIIGVSGSDSSEKGVVLNVDLSKNRLYKKRMERKRRDELEKKNAPASKK